MDIGSIFLILGLLVLVGLYISRPLFEKQSAAVSREEHEVSYLLAERDRVLNSLQELDFDYALGKIPEADYPSQRAMLVQRGVEVLRNLDTLQRSAGQEVGMLHTRSLDSGQPDAGRLDAGRLDAEARIEAAIAARREDAARAPVVAGGNGAVLRPAPLVVGQDDDLETMIASRRRDRNEKAGGFCPQCGGTVQRSDRFCPKCGIKLL